MQSIQEQVNNAEYWYHKIDLPGGITTPGWAPLNAAAYKIPTDLSGKTVLDCGAWDGYWTFKALHCGAKFVQAIDDFSDTLGSLMDVDRKAAWQTFDICKDAFGYTAEQCSRMEISVYNVPWLSRKFDVVFCFGLLYHLRHPLLALEKLRSVCTGEIFIETAILDGCESPYGHYGYSGGETCFEFYPNAEYGCNKSNWYVGTLNAWCKLVEAAGFRVLDKWRLTDEPKSISEVRGFIHAAIT